MIIHAYKVSNMETVNSKDFTFDNSVSTKCIAETLNSAGFEFTEPQIDVAIEMIPCCDATDFFGEQPGTWLGLKISKTKI